MKVRYPLLCAATLLAATLASPGAHADDQRREPLMVFENPTGLAATFNTAGPLDRRNPFFQKLGTNGRSCETCHQASDGWTVVPAHLQARFEATKGSDPIFRLNDGSNSPNADVSTLAARRAAYSMLLTKGLIRVGIGIPDAAEFELVDVDDPYDYASAAELSLFRRPLPTANLKFLSTLMWDGRETFQDPSSTDCIVGTSKCFASLHFDLTNQANSATVGHARAAQALTQPQREAIVQFEMGLFTAQVFDSKALYLGAQGANGGPQYLVTQPSYFGINDVVSGDYRTGAPFNPVVFTLYNAWTAPVAKHDDDGRANEARRAVARGQTLFNTKPIKIEGVKGLNDDLSVPVLQGTCTTCHDTPGSGNHSIPAPLDIGLTDASRRTPDMPLYQLRNKATGELVETTDPGRALITGKWKDVGRFKGPVLRGLASRAPYFHNGFAADLDAVVDFYNQRFGIGLTAREQADLVAFLRAM
jgi:hypothetical protein